MNYYNSYNQQSLKPENQFLAVLKSPITIIGVIGLGTAFIINRILSSDDDKSNSTEAVEPLYEALSEQSETLLEDTADTVEEPTVDTVESTANSTVDEAEQIRRAMSIMGQRSAALRKKRREEEL